MIIISDIMIMMMMMMMMMMTIINIIIIIISIIIILLLLTGQTRLRQHLSRAPGASAELLFVDFEPPESRTAPIRRTLTPGWRLQRCTSRDYALARHPLPC